jgi:hypothetical protein
MSRWFRHYAGMMRDEKLVAVAVKSRQPVERVVWLWGAILESAAEVDDAGRYELDPAEAAYFLRSDEADICSIVDALAAAGRISSGCVVKWSDRQYQSDKSAERQARYRERRRIDDRHSDKDVSGSDVTTPSRDGVVTPQETEEEPEKNTPPTPLPGEGGRDPFDEVWQAFPRNPQSNRQAASKEFHALGKADQQALLQAAKRYGQWFAEDCARRKRAEVDGLSFVPKLSTWIGNGSWREAAALRLKSDPEAPVVVMVRVDKSVEPEVWAECERIQGKPAPTSDWSWAFPTAVVDQARQAVRGRAH